MRRAPDARRSGRRSRRARRARRRRPRLAPHAPAPRRTRPARRSSRQAVNSSSSWSTTSTRRRSPPAGHTTELAHRVLARPHQRARPAFAAGQDPAGQRGQQTGPDDGRLAAAGRADDAEQRRADEPRDELGDELLAAEEVVGVVDVEGRQALVGAQHRRSVAPALDPGGPLARRLQGDDAARRARPTARAPRCPRPPRGRRPRRPGGWPRAAPSRSPPRGRSGRRRRCRPAAPRRARRAPAGA